MLQYLLVLVRSLPQVCVTCSWNRFVSATAFYLQLYPWQITSQQKLSNNITSSTALDTLHVSERNAEKYVGIRLVYSCGVCVSFGDRQTGENCRQQIYGVVNCPPTNSYEVTWPRDCRRPIRSDHRSQTNYCFSQALNVLTALAQPRPSGCWLC